MDPLSIEDESLKDLPNEVLIARHDEIFGEPGPDTSIFDVEPPWGAWGLFTASQGHTFGLVGHLTIADDLIVGDVFYDNDTKRFVFEFDENPHHRFPHGQPGKESIRNIQLDMWFTDPGKVPQRFITHQSPGDLANYFALAPEQLTDWAQIALEVHRRNERADKARNEQVRAQYLNTARQEVLTRNGCLRANWGDSYLQHEAQQSPASSVTFAPTPEELADLNTVMDEACLWDGE
ncbi:MAG: hypothetical protein Q9168_000185 [Polycauliona sp. 1 TL-2023]